jgi:hypothetical protein
VARLHRWTRAIACRWAVYSAELPGVLNSLRKSHIEPVEETLTEEQLMRHTKVLDRDHPGWRVRTVSVRLRLIPFPTRNDPAGSRSELKA